MESDRKLVHWPIALMDSLYWPSKSMSSRHLFLNSPTRPWSCSKRIFAIWVLSRISLVALKVNVWFYFTTVLINNTQYQFSLYSPFDGHKKTGNKLTEAYSSDKFFDQIWNQIINMNDMLLLEWNFHYHTVLTRILVLKSKQRFSTWLF